MNNLEKKVIFCIFSATFLTAGLIIIFSFFLFRSDHRFVELWKQKKNTKSNTTITAFIFYFSSKMKDDERRTGVFS